MSAFSSFQHQHPLPLDSVFLPNSNSTTCFSQFYQTETLDNIDQSTKVSALSNYQTSLLSATNKNSMDSSSTLTHYYNTSEQLINYKSTPKGNKRNRRKIAANSAQSKDNSGVENKKQKKMKDSEEKKLKEEGPKGYIHVRARRGQATDSHSLAERVRREKISERMNLLQSIVPGCDKVTGKAQVLDQIISYVQSLQDQVEFLSMKLASVNPISYDFALELESFMVNPDQTSSSLSSPLLAMQQRSTTTVDDFLHLDDSVNSLLYHEHPQFPTALPEDNGVVCGGVDDQRQNIFNQSGFSNNLFHSI